MDDFKNFVPSGWKRDLIHIVGCYYASQISSLGSPGWDVDCSKFLWDMEDHRDGEWLDIKELSPVRFMGYGWPEDSNKPQATT